MLRNLIVAGAMVFVISAMPEVAVAKCGSGQPASYDDVSSILLTNDYRVSDGYRDKRMPVANLAESTFWIHFWEPTMANKPFKTPVVYSQWTLRGSVGTYHIGATLEQAREILKSVDFFSLSPPDYTMSTEQTFSVLTVRRCAVVTRVIIDNYPEYQDARSARLLADFNELILRSVKTQVSATPRNFEETLIFDP
jgi:hypothetical protein